MIRIYCDLHIFCLSKRKRAKKNHFRNSVWQTWKFKIKVDGLSLIYVIMKNDTMVSLKGTESSSCSVASLSSCWRVSRDFNTWYHFDIILFEYFMTIPVCILPVVLWPLQPRAIAHLSLFPKPFLITVQNEHLLFPTAVTLSWAPLPA